MGAWEFVNLHLSPLLRGVTVLLVHLAPALGEPGGGLRHPAQAGAGRPREPGDRCAGARLAVAAGG